MLNIRNFQRAFIEAAEDSAYSIAAMTIPRGNGKTTLAGYLAARLMTPDDTMFRPGTESVLLAASLDQARITYRVAKDLLGDNSDYTFIDSSQRISITHKPTGTKIRAIGSNGKTAMGLLGTPWAICDEPGAWEVNGGGLMWDALTTARGKPDSPLKIIIVGTLAPMATEEGHWWFDLTAAGTDKAKGVHVTAYAGDLETWDSWQTIRKANPLTSISPEFRKALLTERNEARADSRLKARFCSYRLNVPSADESTMLLQVSDWEALCQRPVPERLGAPIVGIDLGAGRAWSSAVGCWANGRIEAIAVAPGVPDLATQEKRDKVPQGSYQRLADAGLLLVADGLNVPPVSFLVEQMMTRFGGCNGAVADRFRFGELMDAGLPAVEPRVTRWSEASEDIRALRRLVKDGPFSCTPESAPLIAASLSKAMVKSDDAGNTRIVKKGTNNTGRDDVAVAFCLVAGAFERVSRRKAEKESQTVDDYEGVFNP